MAVTRHAATLDTGLVASGYPGGSLTHLSSTHFQYARALSGYGYGPTLASSVVAWLCERDNPLVVTTLLVNVGR